MFRAATGPSRTACCAVGGHPGPRGARGRARRRSRPAPRRSPSRARADRVDGDPAGVVEWDRELSRLGCGATPVVQTQVRVGRVSPVDRRRCPRALLQPGAEPDVDPPAAQLAQGVVGQLEVDLGQNPVGGLDQDPAHPVEASARVGVHGVGGKVLKLGERLEPGVAAADEDVRQQLVAQAASSVAFACSSVSITWLRSQIASARLLKPIACWSSPGTGSDARPSRARGAAGRSGAARPPPRGFGARPSGSPGRGR